MDIEMRLRRTTREFCLRMLLLLLWVTSGLKRKRMDDLMPFSANRQTIDPPSLFARAMDPSPVQAPGGAAGPRHVSTDMKRQGSFLSNFIRTVIWKSHVQDILLAGAAGDRSPILRNLAPILREL